MVICTFFLNNTCRFGSKCHNEHIDIGSMVKNEVDVTLKGNQWPLSCFGPFKERTCIPNFIDDQSFEEVRMMYLEAKLQNNIPAHQMQLAQMINDAKTKLQWLTTMNRDVLNALIELYNQQDTNTNAVGTPSNPFAAIGTNNTNATASNIFGGASGGNAFASSFGTNTAGTIVGNAGGMFGQTAQPSGNMFGSIAAPSSNIFANAGQTQASSNMFGMNQPAQPTNNIFGGPAVMGGGMFGSVQQPAQNTPSLFGSVATQANPAAAAGNIFAKPAQPSNAFGQPSNSGPFGGGNIFGSSTVSTAPATGFGAVAAQPQQSAGLFNTVNFATNQSNSSFGQSFGTTIPAASAANPSSQNLFLPAPTATSTSFGGPVAASPFGNQAQSINLSIQPSATMYSKMEETSAEHLAAFNADQFQLGRIPTIPPPKELCH